MPQRKNLGILVMNSCMAEISAHVTTQRSWLTFLTNTPSSTPCSIPEHRPYLPKKREQRNLNLAPLPLSLSFFSFRGSGSSLRLQMGVAGRTERRAWFAGRQAGTSGTEDGVVLRGRPDFVY